MTCDDTLGGPVLLRTQQRAGAGSSSWERWCISSPVSSMAMMLREAAGEGDCRRRRDEHS